MKSKIIYISLVMLFVSCSLDTKEYMSYIVNPDNGLIMRAGNDQHSYQLMYYPIDLMIAREKSRTNKSTSELKMDFGNEDYFLLEINKNEKIVDEKESFYYAYKFEKDIYQTIEGDTLRPTLYQLEQGVIGSQSMRINLSFPKTIGDREIFVNDKYGANTSFLIEETSINNLPKLSI